jgi:hypothetical protein
MAERPCSKPHALRLTADIGRRPELAKMIADATGIALAGPGEISGQDPMVICLGPKDWIILSPSHTLSLILEKAALLCSSYPMLISDASASLIQFSVTPEQLSSGTSITLNMGQAVVAQFAGLRAIIINNNKGVKLIIEQQYQRYLEAWFADNHRDKVVGLKI